MNVNKVLIRACSVLKSFIYDLRYALVDGTKLRAGASSYSSYRSNKLYSDYLKFGAALEAVKPLALKYCKGKGVDIGASTWPLPGARGIDNSKEENAYLVKEPDASLDFVFSSHTLEHLDKPWDALKEWNRVLRDGGVLFLYLPHPACEMWKTENLKFHIWNPDPIILESHLKEEYNYDVIYVTYLPDVFFSFVVVAKKRAKN